MWTRGLVLLQQRHARCALNSLTPLGRCSARYQVSNFGRSARLVNLARMMRTAVAMGASLAAFPQELEVEPICGWNVRGGNARDPQGWGRAAAARKVRLPVPIDVWKARDPISEGAGRTNARHRHPGRQYR